MLEQRIKIPRASDKVLISCFRELAKITGVSQITIGTLGFASIGSVDLDADLPNSLELILKKNSAINDTIKLNLPALPIDFFRGGHYEVEKKSGIFDEILLRKNDRHGTVENEIIIEIVATINKKLRAFDAKRSVAGTSEEQTQFDAIHNSNIERLESLNEVLIESTHKYRLQLDREFSARLTKLQSDLNDEKVSLNDEFACKESELSGQLEEFDRKRKELDDSSNTHARREIRRDILKEIKSRQTKFSLTEGTNNLRQPIRIAMLGLISIFVVLAGVSVIEFYEVLRGNDISKIIIAGIKQAIYSAGAIGSVIFLIRWMNRWFELHSKSEFELKHFELDMERASWLVETTLEWKDAKGTAIPPELLDSLSNNLFSQEKEKIDPLHHPVDQLASALMGSASSVKLKAGDSSIEIDPKKLAKSKPNNSST